MLRSILVFLFSLFICAVAQAQPSAVYSDCADITGCVPNAITASSIDALSNKHFTDNVGIGTNAPAYKLDVYGDINASGNIMIGGGSLCREDGTNCPAVPTSGWTDGGSNIYLSNTTDNVGVGTTTPSAKLHVVGDSIFSGEMNVGGAGSNIFFENNMYIDGTLSRKLEFGQSNGTYDSNVILDVDSTQSYLNVSSDSANPITFTKFEDMGLIVSGNVAIGTITPSSKLAVVGTVNATAFVGDGSGLTGISSGEGVNWSSYDDITTLASANEFLVNVGGNSKSINWASFQNLIPSGNITINTTSPVTGAGTGTSFTLGIDQSKLTLSSIGGAVTDAQVPDNITITNAGTATALAANGANCAAGNYPLGVDASGAVEDCTPVSGGSSGWTDGGTNVYTSATTDNVGIGTTTPSTTLEIVKQGSNPLLMLSSTATGDGNYLMVTSSGNVGIGTIATLGLVTLRQSSDSNTNGLTIVSNSVGGSLRLWESSTIPGTAGRIDGGSAASQTIILNGAGAGNVGIGTTLNIINKLEVSGAQTIGSAYVGQFTAPSQGLLVQGRVGIGTVAPGDTLEVSGIVKATSYKGDGSALTGIGAGGWVDGGTNIYASPTTDNVAIGTTTPTQKLTVVGTVSATAFVGDGSGITGLSANAWTDGGTNIYPATTSDQVAIGTTTPVAGSILTVKGTIAGSGSGAMTITGGNVGIGTSTALNTLLFVSSTGGTVSSAGAGDVYIQNDLEVDGTVYMGSCSGAGCGTSGGWTDGGTTMYTTTTSDNVGIGTASAIERLYIHGNSTGNIAAYLANANSAGLTSVRVANSNDNGFRMVASGSGYAIPGAYGMLVTTGEKLIFGEEDGTMNVTIDGSGNVGIGSNAPNSILNIPSLKSSSGTRYLCIGTTGIVTSSASACSGT